MDRVLTTGRMPCARVSVAGAMVVLGAASTAAAEPPGASESAAQKANDPSANIHRAEVDFELVHGGPPPLYPIYRLQPNASFALGDFRFRVQVPITLATLDGNAARVGDIGQGITWTRQVTSAFSALIGVRADWGTGDARVGAGLGVSSFTGSAGLVLYPLLRYGLMIIPIVQVRQTFANRADEPSAGLVILRPNFIFFPAKWAYFRTDWTVSFDYLNEASESRLALELGAVLGNRVRLAGTWEPTLWRSAGPWDATLRFTTGVLF